ncbi:MAG TPA: hypothetical protein VFK05_33160 [Polyangiaceae bacterium]|nr:hypothetical protein [Polyangiaceae bacterium]
MGTTLRLCVRALVLTGMTSIYLSLSLPGCRFPDYGMATGGGGNAGTPAAAGTTGDNGGIPEEGGEAGSEAGSPSAGAGMAGAAGAEVVPPEPCPKPQACMPAAPQGWVGPKAFWDAMAVPGEAPPPCPDGYTNPLDRHHGVIEPPGGCQCSCSAINQSCATITGLKIYPDQTCGTQSCVSTTLTTTCNPVMGCTGSQGSMEALKPTPTGGTCTPTIAKRPDPTWQYDSRLCEPSGTYVCDDPTQVCAPTPPPPYASRLCMVSQVSATSTIPQCPEGYPNQTLLYEKIANNRGCTDCVCGGVTGGSCGGKLLVSTRPDCSDHPYDYPLGSGCQPFNLGPGNIRPTSITVQTSVTTPGTCSITTQSQPDDGRAVESGPVTVVCCP